MAQTQFDIQRARRETPGCRNVAHFNNAGAALMPQPVIDAQLNHLQLEAAIGGYEAAEHARATIERVYESAAGLIGADPQEIAIVENATRAWDMAFYALPFQPGDRILTAQAEYASNYIAFLQVARRSGARIEVIPNDASGQVSVAALENMIDQHVRLIAITHVPTNGGLVNPAAAIGRVARQAGVPYLLDACQSIGQLPIDVNVIGCDMLSATGRKYLRGPRGVGFLYVRQGLLEQLEPPLLDLHAATWTAPDQYTIRPDARRFENWESNVAAKIGLGAAIDYARQWGSETIWARISELAVTMRARLAAVPGVTLHDQGAVRCGIVALSVAGHEAETVRRRLAARNINVSVIEPSGTLLDMQARGLGNLVRASLHYYTTEEEIDALGEALAALQT